MTRVRIFIKRLNILSFVDFLELAKHENIKKTVQISVSHTSLPPDLADGVVIGTHNVTISFRDIGSKEELGVCESIILSIVLDNNVDKLYELWSKSYNELPEDLRVQIETKITGALLPSVSVMLEKMGLPPAIPPLVLSPRENYKVKKK